MTTQTVTPRNQLDITPQELARLRAAVDADVARFKAEVRAEAIKPGTDRAYSVPSLRGPRVSYELRVIAWREKVARGKRAAKAQYESWRACKANREAQNARNRAKYAAAKQRTLARAGVNQCPAPARTRGGRGLRRSA